MEGEICGSCLKTVAITEICVHRASWVGTGYNFLETPDPKRKLLTQLPHNSNITALIQVSNDLIGQSGKPHYY